MGMYTYVFWCSDLGLRRCTFIEIWEEMNDGRWREGAREGGIGFDGSMLFRFFLCLCFVRLWVDRGMVVAMVMRDRVTGFMVYGLCGF